MLTKRQKQILDYIKDYIKRNGYPPSLVETGKHFGLSSVATVHQHIEALKEKGYLNKTENQPRSIELNEKSKNSDLITIPLLGTIAAGEPIEAIEDKQTIEISRSQLSKSGEYYALRVQGDSMIDDGIFNGDIAVIRSQKTADDGQTVVAIIDDNQATLKKIFRERGKIKLQPANKNLRPFYRRRVEVRGIVEKIIRTP